MRAGDRADDVEGVFDVRDPVAHRFVQGILQRAAATFDRHDRRAEQFHPVDIGRLTADVFAAHVDHALHAEARGNGGGRHAVLTGAGFCDHARLAHAAGEQCLADRVVDLVRAGVIEIFALQIDLRAAQHLAPAPGVIDRARPTDKVVQFALELGDELGIHAVLLVGVAQFLERMHQRLGDEDAAVRTKVTAVVRQVVGLHRE